MNGVTVLAVEPGVEEELRRLHADKTLHGDLASIGKRVGLVFLGGGLDCSLFGFVVLSNIAEFLFDVVNVDLRSRGERLTALEQEPLGEISNFATGKFHLLYSVIQRNTLEDWNSVSDSFTRVYNEAGSSAVGVEGHYSLIGHEQALYFEVIEHDFEHALSILLRVPGNLGENDALHLSRVDSELAIESVMPNVFHSLPVGDNAVDDWVIQLEVAFLLMGFCANEIYLATHSVHANGALVRADDRGERHARGFFSGNPGLHHA